MGLTLTYAPNQTIGRPNSIHQIATSLKDDLRLEQIFIIQIIYDATLRACLCINYIGIHTQINSMKELLKMCEAKDMRWGIKGVKWRYRWDLNFPKY